MAETANDESSVTRIYVSGLPPSITKDQLRSHFAGKGKYLVTDAHVIADRRIGFIGFPTHELAKSAVQYFNKSFIRMSKISVTLAKPVEVKRDPAGQAVPFSQHSSRRQERKHREPEVISKKRKRDVQDDGQIGDPPLAERPKQGHLVDDAPIVDAEPVGEHEEQGHVKTTTSEEELGDGTLPKAPKSDTDWLRGKTSRLLDLMQEDDRQPAPSPIDSADVEKGPDTNVGSQIEDGAGERNEDPAWSPRKVSTPNGRLFIRNLPFDATEDDLRAVFAPYGRISGVGPFLLPRWSTFS